jgi:histidinol-phosphate aminotransferase
LKSVPSECIFLGNGSDEAIDLIFRVFCNPGKDNVLAIAPTYGMYEVCADINDVEYRKVLLNQDFQIDASKLLAACDSNTKVIFICSPNNPTGNNICRTEIEKVLESFQGIVVVDEAYSDFSSVRPFRLDLQQYSNIVILNTFSKAWGCAAIRLGMAFASSQIIELFNKVKYPYNVNLLTQLKASEVLSDVSKIQKRVNMIVEERMCLVDAFAQLPICEKIYPTDSNFFLAKVIGADEIYKYLVAKGIIVRNRNHVELCGDCLRITIGTNEENRKLLSALRTYKLN